MAHAFGIARRLFGDRRCARTMNPRHREGA
jgi:hypothetical protein